MMNSLDSQRLRQEAIMKRRWQSFNHQSSTNTFFFNKLMETPPPPPPPFPFPAAISRNPSFTSKQKQHNHHGFLESDEQLVSASSMVVPAVTVVLEGRSICQRISLEKHESYQSLARALRQMFVEEADLHDHESKEILDLSNAIPGYLIAYEDMDNDLLLAGDLNWNDFVRVAKRIRIVPVKPNSRKSLQRSTSA